MACWRLINKSVPFFYAEDKSVRSGALVGAVGGSLGTYAGRFAANFSSAYLPSKVSTGIVVDPNKPILLQRIWEESPYPDYMGEATSGAVSGMLPIIVDWSFNEYRGGSDV